MRPLLFSLLVPLALAACGGIATSPDGSDGGAADGGGQHQSTADSGTKDAGSSLTNHHVPLDHRASGEACPSTRGAGSISSSCAPDSGPAENCSHDSDCSAGTNGRCVTPEFDPIGCATACSYDECASDSDCPSGVPCDCRASASDSAANVCVTDSACRTDSDCGSGGYCSPSAGFGSFHCQTAYFCHNAKDTCVDDTDCSPQKCQLDTTAGHWACGGPTCEPPP